MSTGKSTDRKFTAALWGAIVSFVALCVVLVAVAMPSTVAAPAHPTHGGDCNAAGLEMVCSPALR